MKKRFLFVQIMYEKEFFFMYAGDSDPKRKLVREVFLWYTDKSEEL